MQQIVSFLIKYKYFLFFLLLEFIAISFTIQSHSFHKSKFVNSANYVIGGVYKKMNSFREYSHLSEFNEQLLEENTQLKNILSQQLKDSSISSFTVIDTVKYYQKYNYISAKVYKNEYRKLFNFLMLNKGRIHGVEPDQAVVTSKGIIGITNTVSNQYTTVLSILNDKSKVNVKLLNSPHFGSLVWNGEDYNILQLVDLPYQANIVLGDTLVTGGKSTIFPEGIPVGIVNDFTKGQNTYTTINIKLFNDMSAIGPVNIISNLDKKEIETLEEDTTND